MEIIDTPIEGVKIINPRIFEDSRGYFFESYNKREFERHHLFYDFIQDNQSRSAYGVIRGLHFQQGEHAQAKLVRVLQGKVLDVAVDIRPDSPTFGRHVAIELSGENHLQLLIPRGLAHGFSVLSPQAVFSYKCDNDYCKESERGILYNDPEIGIDWKIDPERIQLSEKDTQTPTLKDYLSCI